MFRNWLKTVWAASHEDFTSRAPTSAEQCQHAQLQDRLLILIRALTPSQARAEQNMRGQIRGSQFLIYLHWHRGGVMIWEPSERCLCGPLREGNSQKKTSSEYAYVEAAWLIITLHIERDQTSTKCLCWKQMMCPFSLSGCKLLLQRADFIMKNWYCLNLRGRSPRGSDLPSDLNISLT